MNTTTTSTGDVPTTTIEVFADIGCPFTHVGLRRFFEQRAALGRYDVKMWVRSWPLEIVNHQPLDAHFIAEEVDDIRRQVAPTLFRAFTEDAFPASSIPALALAAAAYAKDISTGEQVSLALRDLLFEQGIDVADPAVLGCLADDLDIDIDFTDARQVNNDHAEGVARGVVGSPHFFTPTGGFFCPALDIHRTADGHLQIEVDAARFEGFVTACFD